MEVIFYDSLAPFTTRSTVLGGSDLHLIQLAEEFVQRGHRATIVRGIGESVVENDVQYFPASSIRDLRADAVVLNRASRFPRGLRAERIVIHVLDTYSHALDCHLPLLVSGRATLVTVSKWLGAQFPHAKDKVVIHPPLDPLPQPWPKKDYDLFLYASAPFKGLGETLIKWAELSPKLPSTARLRVVSPGYGAWEDFSMPTEIELVEDVSPEQYRRHVAEAGGLFYVNVVPETFCLLASMAEAYGTRGHILALHGLAGIPEATTLPSFATDDAESFDADVVTFAEAGCPQIDRGDLAPANIATAWEKLLAR